MATTPPTLVTTSATTWTGTTSPKTANVSVQTGDLIIVIAGTSNPARTVATPAGGGLTWSLVTSATGGAGVNSYAWQATATSTTTVTVSATSSGTGSNWGFLVFVWRNHTGVGASAAEIFDGRAPSLAITTTGANSAIAWGNFDWNAVDGSSRVYRQVNSASPTEAAYAYAAASYTVYVASHADAGAAGAKTVGLTAPAAQDQSMVAVEVKGVTTVTDDPTALIVEIGLAANPGTASPTWTDVTADVLAGDGVSWSRGATSGEQASPGNFAFTLRNPVSTYDGPSLLRRPVRFRANRGGTIYELGRFHVTDVVGLRDGFRRLRVSGTDTLAVWEETKRGGDMAWHLTQAGAVARWPLTDEGPTAVDALGSGVVLEVHDCTAENLSPTYGTVTWGSALVPPPTGGTCVAFEPADPASIMGFTGLVGPLSDSPTLGVSFWMRASADLVTGSSVAVSLHKRADAVFPLPINGIVEAVPQGRTFGFVRDDTGIHPATWPPSGGGGLVATADVANDWVHVEYRQALSGSDVSVTGGVTLLDGTQYDFVSSLSADNWSTSSGAGLGAVIIGGDPAGGLLAAVCEVAEFAAFDKSLSTDSGLVRAAIGWPRESPADRATRLAGEAAWPTAPTISTITPAMSSGPDSRTSLLDGMREIEGVTLGMLTPMADGTVRIFTRAELDEDAAFVSSLSADQMLRDSDGVATNTGLLANSSTVTGAGGITATYRDALADTYGDRSDDRAIATVSGDWVASAASWLAHRQADPLSAFAAPALQLDPDKLRKLQGSWDFTALLPFTTDIGAVITLPDLHTSPLEVIVMGISWQVTRQGQWICSWAVRPHGRMTYAALDATSATLNHVTIGW